MVDFTLTAEQEALRELANDFAAGEIRPVAAELDRSGEFPKAIIAKAHELGLMNCRVPARVGGIGLGVFESSLIDEELSWGCSGVLTSLSANTLGSEPVLLGGSDEVQEELFHQLLAEPKLVAFCLTEPSAGSDVGGLRTRAVRSGDKYVLTGSKTFITNGEYAD